MDVSAQLFIFIASSQDKAGGIDVNLQYSFNLIYRQLGLHATFFRYATFKVWNTEQMGNLNLGIICVT